MGDLFGYVAEQGSLEVAGACVGEVDYVDVCVWVCGVGEVGYFLEAIAFEVVA